MKYRELVYMCLDEIKLASDDSYITEDHILYLISKYRAFLLRQKYEKTNVPAPMSNYQSITVADKTSTIPLPMDIALPRVWVYLKTASSEQETRKATFVSSHRFDYVGNNTRLNFIYCSLDYKNVMQFKTLPTTIKVGNNDKKVTSHSYEIYAIFEDCIKASEFNSSTDILDQECPIESEMVAGVQELVVKDALGIAYRPKDIINNGNDDLSTIGIASGNPKNNK